MNRDSQILSSFAKLGFKPRDNQVEYINRICSAFLDDGAENVVLNAPTGIGKSILGIVSADVCAQEEGFLKLRSLSLSGTNLLLDQYIDAFKKYQNFGGIKGAAQYECNAVIALPGFSVSAEDCRFQEVKSSGRCDACKFKESRRIRNEVEHLTTNYAYYFISRQFSESLDERYMTIYDEAHTVPDLFSDHNAIFVNVKRLKDCIEDGKDGPSLEDSFFKSVYRLIAQLESRKVSDSNYKHFITDVMNVYTILRDSFNALTELHVKNEGLALKYSRLYKKYFGLRCKIGDLFAYQFEHVFELTEAGEVSVKPIFIGETVYNDVLKHSKRNLFMSATITKEFIKTTFGIKNITEIKLDPVFSPENKKFVFVNPQQLNAASLKKPEVLKVIGDSVSKILEYHSRTNDNGIILTPSFDLTEKMAYIARKSKLRVIEHKRGTSLAACIDEFKSTKNAVLIGPSLFEGISLDDDHCRFQILVKCPYPSIGEARIKYIMDNYPSLFNQQMIMKIIQGAGRGVRNKDDHCVTYALDNNIKRLWSSKENRWSDEFETMEF